WEQQTRTRHTLLVSLTESWIIVQNHSKPIPSLHFLQLLRHTYSPGRNGEREGQQKQQPPNERGKLTDVARSYASSSTQ
ncbi:unnamed protein product, partial [Prunus brigantina]